MQEIRERTKDETIKVKGKPKKGSAVNDMRRQMMAKFGKELVKQRGHDAGSSNDTVPEAQAIEQAEEQAFAAVEGIRGFSAGASRTVRYERKQKIKERTAAPVSEAPHVDTNAEHTIIPAHDKPPRARADEKHAEAPPQVFRERMRQAAVKDKRMQDKQQTQRVEIRQRTNTPKERPASAPLHERNTVTNSTLPPPPPTPQERMKQKAVSELRTRRIRDRHIANAPHYAPRVEQVEPLVYSVEGKAVSPDTKRKDTPAIKERPRRSFSIKDKQSGGAFVPKTRSSAAVPKTAVPKPIAQNAKPVSRPLEQAKRRVQRSAQRKLLRQSGQTAKLTAELTQKTAAAVGKAVSAGISAIAGLMGGTVLVAVICVVIIIAGILASPFAILFSNEPF